MCSSLNYPFHLSTHCVKTNEHDHLLTIFLFHSDDVTFESNKLNDVDDEQNIANESNENWPKHLLFSGEFFRYLKRDGVIVQAECLNCKSGNVYNGHMWSNSNFLKHLSVRIEFLIKFFFFKFTSK